MVIVFVRRIVWAAQSCCWWCDKPDLKQYIRGEILAARVFANITFNFSFFFYLPLILSSTDIEGKYSALMLPPASMMINIRFFPASNSINLLASTMCWHKSEAIYNDTSNFFSLFSGNN